MGIIISITDAKYLYSGNFTIRVKALVGWALHKNREEKIPSLMDFRSKIQPDSSLVCSPQINRVS